MNLSNIAEQFVAVQIAGSEPAVRRFDSFLRNLIGEIMSTDFDCFYAAQVRRALVLRDGVVDFDDFVMNFTDHYRTCHGLTTQGRLEIQS